MEAFNFASCTEEQKLALALTEDLFSKWLQARREREACRGSLVWAKSKGREYLAESYYQSNGLRKQRSLGPRTEETEALKSQLELRRLHVKRLIWDLKKAIAAQARVNRALKLNTVPKPCQNALQAIDNRPDLRDILRVVGRAAVFGYQSGAGDGFLSRDHHVWQDIVEVEALASLPRGLELSLPKMGVVIVTGDGDCHHAWAEAERERLQKRGSREAFVIGRNGNPIRMLTVDAADRMPPDATIGGDDGGGMVKDVEANTSDEHFFDQDTAEDFEESSVEYLLWETEQRVRTWKRE